MTTRTRLSVLLISTPLVAFIVLGGLRGKAAGGDATYPHLRVFDDVVSLILQNYVEDPNVSKVMEGAMRGLADNLDPDSAYLTAADVKVLDANETPAAGDVGIELTRQYYLRVIAARDGSPAAQAGLETGDYIRAIDGTPSRDLSVLEGMRMLRGAPGSKVTVTVIRGNAAEPRDFTLVRERTPGAIVTGKMLEGGIGYIRVATFGSDVTAKLKTQASDLAKAGAKRFIVDLRHTAEGPFDRGIDAARLFVKSGTLAMVAGRDPNATATDKPDEKVAQSTVTQTIAAKPGDGAIAEPVTLLTTAGTSGAAELFASALVDNKRADLIGEHTLGRAGLQKLVKLPDGRGLWLTYARYVRSDLEPLQGKGLTPDVEVDEPQVDFDQQRPAGDPILDAAVARLRKAA
jgi:carboxyl-terminal processing protease